MMLIIAVAGLGAVLVLDLLRINPVPTWFYVFAWYPTLLLLDEVARRLGRRSLRAEPRLVASLFLWSAPIWLFFEALNLRLANWYYVWLPAHRLERWGGILLSFATVVPAIVLAERMLDAANLARTWTSRPVPHGVRDLRVVQALGAVALVLALLQPEWFYQLVWGAVFAIADPIVYHRRPDWSLIADLERGHWGRPARLMLGGLLIGVVWEGYNYLAQGGWIYTVPLLERLKLFEMPPLGFLGFPWFALEAWAMYHTLAVFGLAVPVEEVDTAPGAAPPARHLTRRRLGAVVVTALLSVATLIGMEHRTISSLRPTLAVEIRDGRTLDAWDVATMTPVTLADETAISVDSARVLSTVARLATLRGIGWKHALELRRARVTTVCELADADPAGLWASVHALHGAIGVRPTLAEVRVWVSAAQHACARSGT